MSKDKFKVIVVKDEGYIRPKGTISAILPPEREPSRYEVSSQSPFQIIETEKDPTEKFPKTKKDHSGRLRENTEDVFVWKKNNFKKMKRKEVLNFDRSKVKHHPHPPLKKGSLIWDYGPGRTYSTPQTAFDALALFWGMAAFDDDQIVRGYSASPITYTSLGSVLHLHDVNPGYIGKELIIDVDEASEGNITFEALYAPIVGNLDDIEFRVPRATIRGLNLKATLADSFGVAVQAPEVGGALPYTSIDRWLVDQCIITNTDVTPGGVGVGFMTAGSLRCKIRRSVIDNFFYGGPTGEGISGNWNGSFFVESCIFKTRRAGIFTNPLYINANRIMYHQVYIAHSVVDSGMTIFEKRDRAQTIGFAVNNLFISSGYIFYVPDAAFFTLFPWKMDANLYKYSTAFIYEKSGVFSFDDVKNYSYEDENSLDNVDPVVDSDYIPQDGSPLLRSGVGPAETDYLGRSIVQNVVDIGAYQITVASSLDPLTCGYCTVQDLIDETGVEFEELDCESNVALGFKLCEWIGEATNLIDNYCETSWDLESVPGGIRRACILMASEIVSVARQRRKQPIIQIGNFEVALLQEKLFTPEVKELLDLYREMGRAEYKDGTGTQGSLGVSVLTDEDIDYDA